MRSFKTNLPQNKQKRHSKNRSKRATSELSLLSGLRVHYKRLNAISKRPRLCQHRSVTKRFLPCVYSGEARCLYTARGKHVRFITSHSILCLSWLALDWSLSCCYMCTRGGKLTLRTPFSSVRFVLYIYPSRFDHLLSFRSTCTISRSPMEAMIDKFLRRVDMSMWCFLLITAVAMAQQQCYYGPGAQYRGSSDLVPCNSTGSSACCLRGDTCLSGNACYNFDSGNVYQYGCTDIDYKDEACPYKCGFDPGTVYVNVQSTGKSSDEKQRSRRG